MKNRSIDSHVWVGRIVKTQGIKGQVRVSCSRETTALIPGNQVLVKCRSGTWRRLTIEGFRFHRYIGILSFQEVRSLQEAQELVGSPILVEKANLPPLPPGEFYWHELQGLEVKTEQGVSVGKLAQVFSTASHDVFVIRRDSQEILIPAVEEVIRSVDPAAKVMVICPMEGLIPDHDL